MKNIIKAIFNLLSIVILIGCTSSSGLRPYRGVQKEWKISSGATPDNVGGILVYREYPEKPYEIIGSIEVAGSQWQVGSLTESQVQLEKRIIKNAAIESKKYGADAIIVSKQNQYLDRIANVGNDVGQHTIPIYGNRSAVTVIRFKNESSSDNKSVIGTWSSNITDINNFTNPTFKFNDDGSCDLSVEVNGKRESIPNSSYSVSGETITVKIGNKPHEKMKYRRIKNIMYITIDGQEVKFTKI
jgi:hypothetical protein